MHGGGLYGCGDLMRSQIYHALNYLNLVIQLIDLNGYFVEIPPMPTSITQKCAALPELRFDAGAGLIPAT